jgi:hypothetical protein
MSILNKLSNLKKATHVSNRTAMTSEQVVACKAAIKRDKRGYNVHPNSFDIATPYRVALNFDDQWHNYGNFVSADVAAAIGTIVSAAFFGEKAQQGNFDQEAVESNPAFIAWLADDRNAEVIAKANGEVVSEDQPF